MRKPARLKLVGRKVNWADLDHEFAARLLAFIESMGWLLGIISAVRTFAQQLYLWLGWSARKPGFNLAADPYAKRRDGTEGSKHQPQGPPGHKRGFACDLKRLKGCPRWRKVHERAMPYGLAFPVRHPRREDWHVVAYSKFVRSQPVYLPVDPSVEAEVQRWRDWIAADTPDADGWAAVARLVEDCRRTVLRRGDTGVAVRYCQQRLNAADVDVAGRRPRRLVGGDKPGPGKPLPARWPQLTEDGIYGAQTSAAVRAFQADAGLTVDGIVGPETWKALLA